MRMREIWKQSENEMVVSGNENALALRQRRLGMSRFKLHGGILSQVRAGSWYRVT